MPVSIQGALLDGRYRVVKHLGSGGMASVLLCEDERLGRLVAVKRLHADSPVDVEQRFAREAKLGASLNHPNLVSVFDTATDEEGVLIVMEYVEGMPLSRELRRGPLTPDRVARMATELGAALDHAHAQGVVHRDVKPGNVLLRFDGVTKLVDLGIATAADGTRITRSGTVLGTAAYMAPEQLEGREAGPLVDVYAMAAVCFEALSGVRPRTGRTPVQIAHAIATRPPPDLGEAWPSAPPAVADVLRRGLAREPEARPRSAGELGSELQRALTEPRAAPTRRFERPAPIAAASRTGEPGPADAAPAPAPSSRFTARRRSRLPVIAAGALFVVFALAIAIAALSSGGGGDGPDTTGSAQAPERQSGGVEKKQNAEQKQKSEKSKESKAEQESAQSTPAPAASAPAAPEPAEAPAADSTASGAELNDQGFRLMGQGRYAEAIPILQRAVNSFPEGATDLNYAYALFNLGKSLRLAGRPDEAIPILERRLQIPNQTETVRAELELARQASGS